MPPWSKTYRVKCADGTTRVVYKDVNRAIPIELRSTTTKAKASVDGLGAASADVSASRANDVRNVLISLSDRNESLVLNYRMAYLSFMSNPCGGFEEFQSFNREVTREQNQLVKAQMLANTLIELARRGSGTPDFERLYSQIVDLLGPDQHTAPMASEIAIKQARADVSEWIAGGVAE